jgi:ketosteroid isomerase-like protein
MKNVPDSPMGKMYKAHIQFILDKNIEALLDQYTDDALLISSFMKKPLVYKGRNE